MKLVYILSLLLAALFTPMLRSDAAEAESSKPNIVVFLVDDMGLMNTSVPMLTDAQGNPQRHPLNDWYRTPHMERLAEEGVRFSNFYAHSVCSPTRISIMTGQNSIRHGTTNWIHPFKNNPSDFGPSGWNWSGLGKSDLTLPKLLKRAGYTTIHVGKGHFAPMRKEGSDPLNLGFDLNVGGSFMGSPRTYYGKRGYGKGTRIAVPHLGAYHGTDTYMTEALTLEANKKVAAVVEQKNPFFLYMSHYAVHAPFEPDPRFAAHYRDADKPAKEKAFATMVEGVDKSLGDIIANLKQLGVAENTLLILLGDNGSDAPLSESDYSSSAPLRGKKATCYEGGVRVPFICAWAQPNPDNVWQQRLPVAAGAVQTQIGTIFDLMPTLCALADIDIPKDHPIDGFDLKEQLQGKNNTVRSNTFLNHFPHKHRSQYYTSYRSGDWKLIYHYAVEDPADVELYNLKEDPFEMRNIADHEPERLQTMLQALKAEMESKGALYPVKNGEEIKIEN